MEQEIEMKSHRMKSHRVFAAPLLALALLSPSAMAGQKVVKPVTIIANGTGGYSVSGAIGTARNSADGNQRIGCQVNAASGSSVIGGRCEAANAQGFYVACSTTSPQMVQLIQSIDSSAAIVFEFGAATPGQLPLCTLIIVDHNSLYEPKK
jgi:hypothetical protein